MSDVPEESGMPLGEVVGPSGEEGTVEPGGPGPIETGMPEGARMPDHMPKPPMPPFRFYDFGQAIGVEVPPLRCAIPGSICPKSWGTDDLDGLALDVHGGIVKALGESLTKWIAKIEERGAGSGSGGLVV